MVPSGKRDRESSPLCRAQRARRRHASHVVCTVRAPKHTPELQGARARAKLSPEDDDGRVVAALPKRAQGGRGVLCCSRGQTCCAGPGVCHTRVFWHVSEFAVQGIFFVRFGVVCYAGRFSVSSLRKSD